MPASVLHQKLRKLVGEPFEYLSCRWRLIDVLAQEDQVVLQRLQQGPGSNLQSDQYGQSLRRCPETLTLPISAKNNQSAFSDELILVLQGKTN